MYCDKIAVPLGLPSSRPGNHARSLSFEHSRCIWPLRVPASQTRARPQRAQAGVKHGEKSPVDRAELERVRASGLFDPEFYRQTYAAELDGWDDPLEHFLAAGLARGFVPRKDFDPVLYRALVPECGDANPLLHSLASGSAFAPPALSDLFTRTVSSLPAVKGSPDLQLQRNRAYARKAAQVRELPFTVQGERYALKVPEPSLLLRRFRLDRPFAFARLPHGVWDTFWQLDTAEQALLADERTRDLPAAQLGALAARVCLARYGDSAKFDNNGNFAPQFVEEVKASISVHAARPEFMRAVAFLGYPTFKEVAIGSESSPRGSALLRLFAAHFQAGETVHDAMWPKRLLIAGHLRHLPDLCRDRPVVLVASRYFQDLASRWRLPTFTHVEIPPKLAQWQRWDLLGRATEAVAEARARGGRPPVVLTQCGGALSYWLITRLFSKFDDVFYLDLGQALDGWFFDLAELRVYRWMKVYCRSVIAHCRLEPYYRELKGDAYDDWFASLP
jgi:hypothetical protein